MAFTKSLNMLGTYWEFLVVFWCTWLLTYGRGQETTAEIDNNALLCNDTKMMLLEECFKKMPPVKDGIPTTPQALNNSCKAFNSGMECTQNWSKSCLKKQDQEKVTSSVEGALETYRFLCSDKKIQKDFLQYADCYKKISRHWDECANNFILSLKRVDHSKDTLGLCCIRYRYLHCVTQVAGHFCSKNATKFLQKLAESLVLQKSVPTYHPYHCDNVGERNCSRDASSAQSSTKFLSTFSLLHTILSYPTKGLINSLNVLQNLAFSDITTFFCALSREFSPYFNYHHHVVKLVENESKSSSSSTTLSHSSTSQNNNFNKADKQQHTNNFALETEP